MERNFPIMNKKFWKIIRAVYFTLRRGISKGKFLADLAVLSKRGKFAGKAAFHNLMFHHQRAADGKRGVYDFDRAAVLVETESIVNSAAASPALPGFGPSPMVRQLRITESPFPLRELEEEGGNHVDEAAEEFITRFYRDLRKQNSAGSYLGDVEISCVSMGL